MFPPSSPLVEGVTMISRECGPVTFTASAEFGGIKHCAADVKPAEDPSFERPFGHDTHGLPAGQVTVHALTALGNLLGA
jgi:hypothetical protein